MYLFDSFTYTESNKTSALWCNPSHIASIEKFDMLDVEALPGGYHIRIQFSSGRITNLNFKKESDRNDEYKRIISEIEL